LSSQDDYVYCPFAYGYSNYSRRGYAPHLLTFDDLVTIADNGRCRSTLGGTGLAISSKSRVIDVAVEYAMFTASPMVQQTLFMQSGGQPGHRSAWIDENTNRLTNDYFKNTLPALDRAYLRPRFPKYLHFQDHGGDIIRDYNMIGSDPRVVLSKLKDLFAESLH
jgi:multiple sugar transport system substrate-binding protein